MNETNNSGFVLRFVTDIGGGSNSNNARAKVAYTAYE